MKNMGDYHDLYLETDVLLLAVVFEKLTSISLELYKLDSPYYFSSLGLSWNAMLKMTEIKLELISDIESIILLKKD